MVSDSRQHAVFNSSYDGPRDAGLPPANEAAVAKEAAVEKAAAAAFTNTLCCGAAAVAAEI